MNNINQRKKIILSREKQIKNEKIVIVCSCLMTIIIIISIIATIVYNKFDNKIFANANINQNVSINDSIDKQKDSNNNIYIPLEEDENAESAIKVSECTESILKGQKNYPVRTDGKKVAYLTFDDGPSIQNTQKILDILNKYDIKATFFVTGSAVVQSSETKNLVKQIAKNGNGIGNHTYTHDYSKLYPKGVIDSDIFMREVEQTNLILKNILGESYSTKMVRFPGGYWSWNGRNIIRPIIDKQDYAIINWNSLNGDAEGKSKNAKELLNTLKRNTENLGPKADSVVILMHDTDAKGETVKALPSIIEYLQKKGFEFKCIK